MPLVELLEEPEELLPDELLEELELEELELEELELEELELEELELEELEELLPDELLVELELEALDEEAVTEPLELDEEPVTEPLELDEEAVTEPLELDTPEDVELAEVIRELVPDEDVELEVEFEEDDAEVLLDELVPDPEQPNTVAAMPINNVTRRMRRSPSLCLGSAKQ